MVYFVSDVHLGYGERTQWQPREELFIALLDAIAPRAQTLFVVGDIFDYWFEYRRAIPREFFRTIAAFDRFRRRGANVEYIVGNHDFGHRDFFEQDLGITIHWSDVERTIDGKRFYIAHGDGKVAGDRGYLLLRAVLRSKLANAAYRWVHPDIGIGLAALSSKKSRHYSSVREYGTGDSLEEFARKKICDDGFDYVVMGHSHRSAYVEVARGSRYGYYVNLGDWIGSTPLVGIFDGERFQLTDVCALVVSARSEHDK
ncbi:MAG: UDP-2,3-diacylglucosamine diphosphatase [Chlorobi bacterium]|nr:UDP-2,3-diacylglucosamine diphosphatase [Chlorobiota bacterium]